MIPAGFLQALLARTDIVGVVGRHVELKRGGANFMGLCPFHGERSPSFSVSPAKQFYYCFGCGATGDAIKFLSEHLGLSFVEAVRELAGSAGLTVPEENVSPDERARRDTLRQRRQSLGDVLDKAAAFYRQQLKATPRAVAYCKQRGLSGSVAARFGLGFAPPGWRTLAGVFASYDDPLLEEAGLVRQRQADEDAVAEGEDRGRYDWFRDRLMFPIRSVDGKTIAFGGRVLDDSKPKYMNSPETPLFSKGRELYGLFEARQALRDKGAVLVVEGYMDVVVLAQNGFANAVATLGTACTTEHVQKLFRFTDSVVFSFDGDAAGRRAAARALEAALPHASDTRSVRFLFLPPEHDPDSYVRTLGPAAFEAALAQAVPLSRQLVEHAGDGCDLATAEGRARMLAHAKPLWQSLPDGALKGQLLPELARQAQLPAADLAALWQSASAAASPARQRAAGVPVMAQRSERSRTGRRAPAASADLALRLLLRHADWWERLAAADHELLHALEGSHGAALRWLEGQLLEHGPLPWGELQEAMATQDWATEAQAWVAAAAPDEEQRFEDLQRVLQRLLVDQLTDSSNALVQAAASASDESQQRAALDQLSAVNRQIGQIKSSWV